MIICEGQKNRGNLILFILFFLQGSIRNKKQQRSNTGLWLPADAKIVRLVQKRQDCLIATAVVCSAEGRRMSLGCERGARARICFLGAGVQVVARSGKGTGGAPGFCDRSLGSDKVSFGMKSDF